MTTVRALPARRLLPALLALALAAGLAPPARAATPADSAAVPAAMKFGRRDAWFGLAAAGAVALVATQDAEWSERAHADSSQFALDLAATMKRLGDPVYLACGLIAADGIARLAGHRGAAAATERIAFSVAAAGASMFVVKVSVGRWRPDEAPGDPGRFDPFSGHDSFPSGHTTAAFALVTALDAETRTRWVPLLGYPAATLTAWSRVRDLRHWPSDVVAGAAIGGWVAAKADAFAKGRWPDGLIVAAWPQAGGATLVAGARF
jgi:membrane-associated phospholipid phosphatase